MMLLSKSQPTVARWAFSHMFKRSSRDIARP